MTTDTPAESVSVAEAARRLGCSRDTVYAAIKAEDMPAIKLTPHCIRIPRAAFERYIRGEWTKPVTPPQPRDLIRKVG